MNNGEYLQAQAIYRAGVNQAIERRARERRTRPPIDVANQLIREALNAFTDPETVIDVRDWIKAAQAHLEGPGHV